MQEWEERALEQQAAKNNGIQLGMQLIKKLLADNRLDDMERALSDDEFRKQLLHQYHLDE